RAGEVQIQDDELLIAFDGDSGALTRMENKTTHWVAERRPELGVSFQMNTLLPDRRNNLIHGQKQPQAEVTKISDGEIHLQWKNLVNDNGETFPITLASIETLTNGALTFATTVENASSLMVESVDDPWFGYLNRPQDGEPLVAKHM